MRLTIAFPGNGVFPAHSATFAFTGGDCGNLGTISAVGTEARFRRDHFAVVPLYPYREESACSADTVLFRAFLFRVVAFSVQGNRLELISADGITARFNRTTGEAGQPSRSDDVEVVTPRVNFIDGTGFALGVQEQKSADGIHREQAVNWVAWSPGRDGGGQYTSWEADHVRLRTSADDVNFDRGTSLGFGQTYERPCLLASIVSYEGSDPVTLRYRYLTGDGVHLHLTEDTSATAVTAHTAEDAGYVAARCGYGPGFLIDHIDRLTAEWSVVALPIGFVDPVVVAGPPSRNGADPGVVEVRNVAARSFEIRYREWDYLDRRHPTTEEVSFVVVERGVTVLRSGARLEAGSSSAADAFSIVDFAGAFDEPPVLITTVLR
ncbi:MAG: hypothetical protein HKN74_06190 [Acidimicrobiia bacterium]|nr:hypothetical protein [Acidimicrobiia bacterium]NNL70842.1 hypothetical protein [Acidimicrobiia bacterium]